MNRERWRQVDRIFEFALERPPDERAAYLNEVCDGDEELRREVESLIAHDRPESFMERAASRDAARLIAKSGAGPRAGQTIGHYKILEQLGAGGMGEVFLAEDTRLNRRVALKLLSPQLTTDAERVRRFRQEALAASALNHPNILTIYEIDEQGDRPFIATEYVEGVTLRTRMRGKRLSLADSARHRAPDQRGPDGGALGGDRPPRHQARERDGQARRPRQSPRLRHRQVRGANARADFKQSWIRTATGVVIGTTAYMSPEQARGERVDARTDIWSLGVILYEMVSASASVPRARPRRSASPPSWSASRCRSASSGAASPANSKGSSGARSLRTGTSVTRVRPTWQKT